MFDQSFRGPYRFVLWVNDGGGASSLQYPVSDAQGSCWWRGAPTCIVRLPFVFFAVVTQLVAVACMHTQGDCRHRSDSTVARCQLEHMRPSTHAGCAWPTAWGGSTSDGGAWSNLDAQYSTPYVFFHTHTRAPTNSHHPNIPTSAPRHTVPAQMQHPIPHRQPPYSSNRPPPPQPSILLPHRRAQNRAAHSPQ